MDKINAKLSELESLFTSIENAVDASGNSFKKMCLFYRYFKFINVNAGRWLSIGKSL